MADQTDFFGKLFRAGAVLLPVFGILLTPWPGAVNGSSEAIAAERDFSSAPYAAALKSYVDRRGLVNYTGLKEGRRTLDDFASSIAGLDRKTYDGWNEKEKIAFWTNAYNALTLVAIIDNYPIKTSFLRSLRFPKNSIRQISGVWDKLEFPVMGRNMTLDGIEHDNLRAKFNEPRIHMALVCAALGCPILRDEPYNGAGLDARLDDQTARFLSDPRKFRVDRKKGRVYLSSIFKWFGSDFVKSYGTAGKVSRFGETERAVLNFVSRHLDPKDRDYLEKGEFSIEYLPYDWTLNEKKG